MNNQILIVDDEEIISESLVKYLSGKGYCVITADSVSQGRDAIKDQSFDLILLDLKLPDGSGIELLKDIKELEQPPLVIVMTAYGTVENAVTAMKMGAYDFIQKPFRTRDIELIVRLALETRKLDSEVKQIIRNQAEKYGVKNIIGVSKPMQDIFEMIKKVAKVGANSVLILGESGTGKELVAKAVHYESRRAIWPFVAINCSAIPQHLLESELYGHERGAFTDAKEKKIGLFEKANKGSLLLDEIGDMSPDLQTKLLRTLEDRKIRRIGGTEDINLDIQIIAATNQNLEHMVENGRFRKDLYFRLKVIEIKILPLKEHKDDIPLLMKYFLNYYNEHTGKKFKGFEPEAEKAFMNYAFPGNVRELRNIIEKIVILEDAAYIGTDHLPAEMVRGKAGNITSSSGDLLPNLDSAEKAGLTGYIENIEKSIIEQALKKSDGNKSDAARLLKIDRSTLRYKMRHYGIKD
jgi:two-component system response regulator AtoC